MNQNQLMLVAKALEALHMLANNRGDTVWYATKAAFEEQGINYSDLVSAKTIIDSELNRVA